MSVSLVAAPYPCELAETLDEEYTRAERYERPLSLALLAVDGLDQISEAHGLEARRAVLEAVAEICRKTLRRHDVVSETSAQAFALLLVETGHDGAYVAANRLRAAIRAKPISYEGRTFALTASVGVVSVPHMLVSNAQDLMALASAALYDAQCSGTDCVMRAL